MGRARHYELGVIDNSRELVDEHDLVSVSGLVSNVFLQSSPAHSGDSAYPAQEHKSSCSEKSRAGYCCPTCSVFQLHGLDDITFKRRGVLSVGCLVDSAKVKKIGKKRVNLIHDDDVRV